MQVGQLVKQQENRPVIHCDGVSIQNVLQFKSRLMTMTSKPGWHSGASSGTSCMLQDSRLPVDMRYENQYAYKAAVWSVVSYGCETWSLTPLVMRQICGVNNRSRMLVRFTDRSIPQEDRPASSSYVQRYSMFGKGNGDSHVQMTGTHSQRRPRKADSPSREVKENTSLPVYQDPPQHNSLSELAVKAKDCAACPQFNESLTRQTENFSGSTLDSQ